MIQMSTPVKRKKRRISATQVDRLSIIPKFDKSFTFFPDDDFTVSSTDRLCFYVLTLAVLRRYLKMMTASVTLHQPPPHWRRSLCLKSCQTPS